jgi:predicted DNA-binding transcriptional regulator YafY
VERAIGRWSTVEPHGAQRCRVHMTTVDLEWPVLALAQLDADFTVVAPPELADRIAGLAERFGAASRS